MSTGRASAHRHDRFIASFAAGVAFALAVWLALRAGAHPYGTELAVLAGADAFCLAYLWLILRFARAATPALLRTRAAREDEGLGLILTLAASALTVSLIAIFAVVNRQGGVAWPEAVLALAAVPLGWAMVHVLATMHYAHLFYEPGARGGGLTFPGTQEPGLWDFLYFAFGIGMTAQVSDVVVTGSRMRRVVTVHAVASFSTNTVILALTVNAAMTVWA
jgi:uncharacterized membrane protein